MLQSPEGDVAAHIARGLVGSGTATSLFALCPVYLGAPARSTTKLGDGGHQLYRIAFDGEDSVSV